MRVREFCDRDAIVLREKGDASGVALVTHKPRFAKLVE